MKPVLLQPFGGPTIASSTNNSCAGCRSPFATSVLRQGRRTLFWPFEWPKESAPCCSTPATAPNHLPQRIGVRTRSTTRRCRPSFHLQRPAAVQPYRPAANAKRSPPATLRHRRPSALIRRLSMGLDDRLRQGHCSGYRKTCRFPTGFPVAPFPALGQLRIVLEFDGETRCCPIRFSGCRR